MASVISFDGFIPFYDESLTTILAYVPVYTVDSYYQSVVGYFTSSNYPIYEPRFPINQIARTKSDSSGVYFKAVPNNVENPAYMIFSAWNESGNVVSDYKFGPTCTNTAYEQAGPLLKRDSGSPYYYLGNYEYQIGSSSRNFIYSNYNGPLAINETPGPIPEPKNPINFYRSSEPGIIDSSSIELERGESSSPLEFTIVYDDGAFEEYTGDVEYSGDGLGTSYTIDDNVITISDDTKRASATITAKPVNYPELFTLIPLVISNPLGPYDDGGYSGPSGGGGGFGKDEISDSIFGDLPPGSVDAQDSATGMYTRYLMNSSYLDLLGDWVWDPNLGLSLIQTAIKPFFNDPEQALISLISFPFQLSAPLVGISTRSQPCYFGHQPTGAPFVALTTQSAQINWGTIDLQEYWGNFLDYAPHTKIELYLPWGTGFVNLDPGQCLPGTLTVITNIELQRGSCVHNVVNSAGCVIGSYAGQCGKQIPLIASDIAAKRAGLVTAAAGALVAGAAIAAAPAAMASGYSAGVASSGIVSASRVPAISTPAAAQYRADVASSFGMKGAESSLNTVERGSKAGANIASKSSVASLKTPVSVQRNGGFTDGSAGMGIQYPYIILSRPEQNVPENYGHHFGYPSNVYVKLSSLRGYTEIGSIHLDSIPATNAELEELDGILKGGVIF